MMYLCPLWMQEAGRAVTGVQGAGAVSPLYISKLNTVLQLMAVAGFLLHAQTGWPPLAVLDVAAAVTTGTTVLSGAAYVQAFRKGHL
jgi:phosphatidylglycerophosphate synthase